MADKTNNAIPEKSSAITREAIEWAMSELGHKCAIVWVHQNSKGQDVFIARFRATPMQVLDSELELQRREGIKPRLN